jgi:hypothetical protein
MEGKYFIKVDKNTKIVTVCVDTDTDCELQNSVSSVAPATAAAATSATAAATTATAAAATTAAAPSSGYYGNYGNFLTSNEEKEEPEEVSDEDKKNCKFQKGDFVKIKLADKEYNGKNAKITKVHKCTKNQTVNQYTVKFLENDNEKRFGEIQLERFSTAISGGYYEKYMKYKAKYLELKGGNY